MGSKIALAFVAGLALASSAFADWNPGDGHKMHYPQTPDPVGIDVNMTDARLADDFRCSETGPITDIHFWWSVQRDSTDGGLANVITSVRAQIYSDIPGGIPGGPNYSQPGALLWDRTFSNTQPNVKSRPYGLGQQSFWNPPFNADSFNPNDHFAFYQTNITNIDAPFVQTEGTIYWLSLQVTTASQDIKVGWKTSFAPQFNDTHVYLAPTGGWLPSYDPRIAATAVPLDLAFVITPTPGAAGALALGALAVARRRR